MPRSARLSRTCCACLLVLLVASGCKKKVTPPAAPPTRTYTFKALAGISMGAMGASLLAGAHRSEIDALASIGGPLAAPYFLGGLERMQIGGFCSLAQLQALAQTNPAGLNDPSSLSCPPSQPWQYEHQQQYNHWQYTDNGGNFDRDDYLDLFFDLSLAMGNPLYYNPQSPIFPAPAITKANYANACAQPIVFSKANGNPIYNAEYNPTGDYDVITFCDGQTPVEYCNDANQTPVDWCQNQNAQDFCTSIGATQVLSASTTQNPDLYYAQQGVFNPCYPLSTSVAFALAVDINGNGKRDYFEPVIVNGHERFSDVGSDGCPDSQEDGHGGCTAQGATGDPNGDNYDYMNNPLGTEGNFVWDPGEPFDDNGLDGVPNTGDYGENNGKYDDGPNRAHWLAENFATAYTGWSDTERQGLDVYADGGNRDVFNLGLQADITTSLVRWFSPSDSKRYTDYTQLPPLAGFSWMSMGFNGLQVDYSQVGRNMFMLYGTPADEVTTAEIRDGDGDHVGTTQQLLNRVITFVMWMSEHWQKVLGPPKPINSSYGGTTTQIVYQSTALGALRNFDVSLPQGYGDPALKGQRYPVFSLGHGYGMTANQMSQIADIFSGFAGAGYMLPMIVIYPSGRCCFIKPDGTKDCRDTDENGVDLSGPPYNYVRECITGNFYVNRQGYVPGDDTPYGDALFELFDYVDQNFDTLGPMTVPLDSP